MTSYDKVLCSRWLNNHQVIFGTKCNSLMIYDIYTTGSDLLIKLKSNESKGIYTCEINPSRTLLATGVTIFRLSSCNLPCPIDVGVLHTDTVFSQCWIDDQFLVSGSRDTKLALWQIAENCSSLLLSQRTVKSGVRAICYNKRRDELAIISLDGSIYLFESKTLSQKTSEKLLNKQELVCIASPENGDFYAIGSRAHVVLVAATTLKVIKDIASGYSICGIRSLSFHQNILTIGTGVGVLMFYDVAAGNMMENELRVHRSGDWPLAIFTHCYDQSHTKLFAAGGPLEATSSGSYWELFE